MGAASYADFGAPDQIRAEVRQRIEQLGLAGLLLAPAEERPVEGGVGGAEASA